MALRAAGDGAGLLRAVSLIVAFSERPASDLDAHARRLHEVTDGLDRSELQQLVAALAGLASWSIASLVPLALPGQDPREWIEGYVETALRVLDETE